MGGPVLCATSLLENVLASWDRNNNILVNLLRIVPTGGLEAKATQDGPSVARMFTHMHYVRLVFIAEDAPDLAQVVPENEWLAEPDADRIARMLNESAKAVREVVQDRIESRRQMKVMIWHEGYHHGQIKLALKLAGTPISDEEAGRVTWSVWMRKKGAQ